MTHLTSLSFSFLVLTGFHLTSGDDHTKQASGTDPIQDLRNEFDAKLESYNVALTAYKMKTQLYEETIRKMIESLKKRMDNCENTNQNRIHVNMEHGGNVTNKAANSDTKERANLDRESNTKAIQSDQGDCRRERNRAQTEPIAFYAELIYDQSNIGHYQNIVFDLVTTNIGNGYSIIDGEFNVPVSGVYVFIWVTTNKGGHHLQSELMVNGVVNGRQWSDSDDDYDSGSATGCAVLSVVAGDAVWVRSNDETDGYLTGSRMSSFSGWLLY